MNTINLLVVDDNKDLVATLKNYLEENTNIRIKYVAKDGEEAIRIIDTNKKEIDVLLLEPLVPKVDGLSILEYMREKHITKKTIIMSSYKDQDILSNLKSLNVIYYVMKPFALDTLAKRIENLSDEELLDADAEKNELQKKITKVIHDLGVPSNLKGYNYLREGISLVYYNPDMAHKITKVLYPKVAEKFTSTDSRVERSMRHAIEVSWNRGDLDTMEDVFGYSVSIDKSKPTNSEFIVTIADMLRLEDNKGYC